MTETVFEKLAAAVSVLKLDFSSEEFAVYAGTLSDFILSSPSYNKF